MSWLQFDWWIELDLGSNLTCDRVWFPECTCHWKETMMRKDLILYQRVFFSKSVIPYLPKKNLKQNPFKTTKKQDEFEHIQMKKKKKTVPCSLKLVTLMSCPLNNFSWASFHKLTQFISSIFTSQDWLFSASFNKVTPTCNILHIKNTTMAKIIPLSFWIVYLGG